MVRFVFDLRLVVNVLCVLVSVVGAAMLVPSIYSVLANDGMVFFRRARRCSNRYRHGAILAYQTERTLCLYSGSFFDSSSGVVRGGDRRCLAVCFFGHGRICRRLL